MIYKIKSKGRFDPDVGDWLAGGALLRAVRSLLLSCARRTAVLSAGSSGEQHGAGAGTLRGADLAPYIPAHTLPFPRRA